MEGSASGFEPGSGRSTRRHTVTSSTGASFMLPASAQNSLSCQHDPSGRQRSLSSTDPTIPLITLHSEDGTSWPVDENFSSQGVIKTRSRMADPLTSLVGLGIDLGAQGPMPNNINLLSCSDYSPGISPVHSPVLSSPGFESPAHSPSTSINFPPSSPASPNLTNFAAAAPATPSHDISQTYANSALMGKPSHKPWLMVNTRELDPSGCFGGSSDGYSGSTSGWGDTSSQDTSPAPSNTSSGYHDMDTASPLLDETVFNDVSFFSFTSQNHEQQHPYEQDSSGEDNTPTALSQHLLVVPGSESRSRRESDPFPRSNTQVQDESSRIHRSRSQRSRRSPSRSREHMVQDMLNSNLTLQDRLLQNSSPVPRPLTPGTSKGKRHGPMTEEGRLNATDRRVNKDTCVSCKVARVKCDPSADLWGNCAKCQSGPSMKSNGAQLCGPHSFSHKVAQLALDYRANYWITPLRLSTNSRSRIFLPMPQSLVLRTLQTNFSYLLRNSCSAIRVSSNNTVLYDISLEGAMRYLSNERNSSLSSHRDWPAFINTLSADPDDGWLDCLAHPYQLRSADDVLNALPYWTIQQGCFTYSIVSAADNTNARQLDPEEEIDRTILISAAQASRVVSRKVERIGFNYLQAALPSNSKDKPSTDNPPKPSIVHILGVLALALRFQYSVWHLSRLPCSLRSLSIPESTHSDCVEAIQWICRSLYVNHCWLHRILAPTQPPTATPSIDVSHSSYAGTALPVQELMSRGETDTGFMEWWTEGAVIVSTALVDPVVTCNMTGNGGMVMSRTGFFS